MTSEFLKQSSPGPRGAVAGNLGHLDILLLDRSSKVTASPEKPGFSHVQTFYSGKEIEFPK